MGAILDGIKGAWRGITGQKNVDNHPGAFNVGGSKEAYDAQKNYLWGQQGLANQDVTNFIHSGQGPSAGYASQAMNGAAQAGAAVNNALQQGPAAVDNPYIGRTNADTLAAQQTLQEGQRAAMASGQALGGIAGARAAAFQNNGAQAQAQQTQQIMQAQERASMAGAYNQNQAIGNAQQLGVGQLGAAVQGQQNQAGVGFLTLDQQRQLAQAQAAQGQSSDFLTAGLNNDQMQLQGQGANVNASLQAHQSGLGLISGLAKTASSATMAGASGGG